MSYAWVSVLIADAYWKALLKSAVKSMSTGSFPLLLLDAPHPRGEQLREAWLAGQKAGYEVMVVKPLSMDAQVRGAAAGVTVIALKSTGDLFRYEWQGFVREVVHMLGAAVSLSKQGMLVRCVACIVGSDNRCNL